MDENNFIDFVKSLHLRFPIAEISKKTGYSEGVVSRYLNGKILPSEKFLQVFYEKFKANKNQNDTVEKRYSQKNEAIQLLNSNIQYVPFVNQYAQAGYLEGYNNTTFMNELPKIPFITEHYGKGNYLAFEVRGDSMTDGSHESILNGDILLCREIMQQHWVNKLHINKWTFVIAHKTDGIIIKKITNHDVTNGVITVHSLNHEYEDYEISLNDVAKLFNVIKIERKI